MATQPHDAQAGFLDMRLPAVTMESMLTTAKRDSQLLWRQQACKSCMTIHTESGEQVR